MCHVSDACNTYRRWQRQLVLAQGTFASCSFFCLMQYKVPLVQCTFASGYLTFIHLGGVVVVRLLLLNLQPNNFSANLLRSSKSANSSSTTAGEEPELEPESDAEVVSPMQSPTLSDSAASSESEDSTLLELDDVPDAEEASSRTC